jgi:hypothetical protein
VVDALKALGDIGIKDVLGLFCNRFEERINRVMDTPSWPETIAVWLKVSFPFWF